MAKGEEYICSGCNSLLPRTNLHLEKENEIEKRFWGKVEIERATAFFYYSKGSDYRKILHHLKYRRCKEIGEVMGRYFAKELISTDFFEGIDLIIPVPLHPKRMKARGYNQSEWIAKGISRITLIPLDTKSLKRNANNQTQTRRSVFDRWKNVENIFELTNYQDLEGKHILLIDDVLTTGATLVSCAMTIKNRPNTKVSILTLAVV